MATNTATVNTSKNASDSTIWSLGHIPTASEDAVVNIGASGNFIINSASQPTALSWTINSAVGGIMSGSNQINCYGAWVYGDTNLTSSWYGALNLVATSGTNNIDTKGVTVNNSFVVQTAGTGSATYFQVSDIIVGANAPALNFNLKIGTWNFNNKKLIVPYYILIQPSVGAVTMSNCTYLETTSGANANPAAIAITSSTYTLTTSLSSTEIRCQVGSVLTSGINIGNFGIIDKVILTGSNTTGNFTVTQLSNSVNTLSMNFTDATKIAFSNGCTVNTALIMNGYSVTKRLLIQVSYITTTGTPSYGSTFTKSITCNGTITASNLTIRELKGAGSASWTLSAITGGCGDGGGNSGITFNSPRTLYWVGNGGNFKDGGNISTTSNGAADTYTLAQDTLILNQYSITSSGQTVTIDMQHPFAKIDTSGVLNSPTFSISNNYCVQGDCDFSGLGSYTSNGNVIMFFNRVAGVNANLKTFSGCDLGMIQAYGYSTITPSSCGYLIQQSDIIASSGTIMESGGIKHNNFNYKTQFIRSLLTNGQFYVNHYLGNGTIELTGTADVYRVARYIGTTFVIIPGSGTIKISDNSVADKNINILQTDIAYNYPFNLGSVWFSGTGALVIKDSAMTNFTYMSVKTFANMRLAAGTTLKLPDCTTYSQKLVFDSFTFEGTVGSKNVLTSTANTSKIDISASQKAISRVLDAKNCNVSNINCLTINTLYGVGTNSGNTNYYNQAAGRTKYKFFGASNKIRSQFKSTEFNKYK